MSNSETDESGEPAEPDVDIVDMTEQEISEPSQYDSANDSGEQTGDDAEPMDIAEAMATDETVDTEPEQTESDDIEHDYDDLVKKAAYYVHEGIWQLSDLELPDELLNDGHSLSGYRDDVREYIETRTDELDTADPEQADQESEDKETVDAVEDYVDWQALWEEYGFGEQDAAGTVVVSKTQLIGAIEASDQGIAGDALAHIKQGVDSGTLKTNYATSHEGTDTLRGYVVTELHG